MRLFLIAVFCLASFFPAFWLLAWLINPEVGSWAAMPICWVLLPAILLNTWKIEPKGWYFRLGNALLAILVLLLGFAFLASAVSAEGNIVGAIGFLLVYGYPAIYYLIRRKMPFRIKEES